MTAREEFNRMLNTCHDPIRVYNALTALASKPNVQKADNMLKKRTVILGETASILNQSTFDESVKQAV